MPNFIDTLINMIRGSRVLNIIPKMGLGDLFEIAILVIIIYYLIKHLRGTRAWLLFKGVLMALGVYSLAYIANLNVILTIFQSLAIFAGFAIVVAIQPELRKLIENLGTKSINVSTISIIRGIFKNSKTNQVKQKISDNTIQELVKGCFQMGKVKTGALICIEGNIPLKDYVESGIAVDAVVTGALLINIFEKNTPLHDGAVIIQNDRVTAATCYLPLSDSKKINKDLGTRHRAAIGLSENTDALVIVVSEETGAVSVARGGKLKHNLNREKLFEEIHNFQNTFTVKVDKNTQANFKQDWPIKALSIITAAMLWVIVINTTNPIESTVIKNIPVEIINDNAITDNEKTYEILSGKSINVKITDRKDVLDMINENEIKAVADFSKLSITNAVPIEVELINFPDTDIRLSESTMKISMEDLVTTEFGITIETVGELKDTLYISNISLDNDTLIISGAKSTVNTIGSVVVEIDQSKITSDTKLELIPKIYDKNGKKLDNEKFILNYNTIKANISMYNTKLVPLNIKAIITDPVLKSIVENIDYENKEIYVAGPDDLLKEFNEVNIEIPINISLTEISRSQFIKNIPIQGYLPDGIYVTKLNASENLIIDFVEFYTNNIIVSSTDISIMGLKEKYKATIETGEYSVHIVGQSSDIEKLTIDNIKPYIDVSDLTIGTHNIDLKFLVPNGSVIEDVKVKVTISDKG